MPFQFLRVAVQALVMYSCVFTGMFFISGQIFKSVLGPFYAATGFGMRTAIASVTVFAAANFLGGWMMARFSPALAAPVMIAAYVLLQIVFTIGIIGYRPSLWILPATALVMAGCVWVSLLLGRG